LTGKMSVHMKLGWMHVVSSLLPQVFNLTKTRV
jgi:hypothetical protein